MKDRRWIKALYRAQMRCTVPNKGYWKNYGGRGIRCLLTKEQAEFLWNRDSASKMFRPSLDRIDPNGNYSLENCQFIEHSENSGKRRNCLNLGGECIRGHALRGDNVVWAVDRRFSKRYLCCRECKNARNKAYWRSRTVQSGAEGKKEAVDEELLIPSAEELKKMRERLTRAEGKKEGGK